MRRPYSVLFLIALGIMAIATHPRFVLVAMAYAYLMSAFIGLALTRFRHRGQQAQAAGPASDTTPSADAVQ